MRTRGSEARALCSDFNCFAVSQALTEQIRMKEASDAATKSSKASEDAKLQAQSQAEASQGIACNEAGKAPYVATAVQTAQTRATIAATAEPNEIDASEATPACASAAAAVADAEDIAETTETTSCATKQLAEVPRLVLPYQINHSPAREPSSAFLKRRVLN